MLIDKAWYFSIYVVTWWPSCTCVDVLSLIVQLCFQLSTAYLVVGFCLLPLNPKTSLEIFSIFFSVAAVSPLKCFKYFYHMQFIKV